MKNVLYIVIDSVTNNQVFNYNTKCEKTPFLSELRKKSISGDKMFSQAPYTEAALMGLLASSNTLDDGGYLEEFKDKNIIINEFIKNGYKTFSPCYYPCIYPSYNGYKASEYTYVENFNISQLWQYRFYHFKELYLNGETTEHENNMLVDMLEDNIKSWIKLLELFKDNSEETILMNDCIDHIDIDKSIKQIKDELKKFNKNKEQYLKCFFEQGPEHILFKIKNFNYVDKINNDEFRIWIKENYLCTFKKIKSKQIKRNLKNARFPISKLIRNINNKECVKGLLAGYKNLIFDKDLMDRINDKYDLFKNQRSFRTVADITLDWIDKNKNSKEPWMVYLHVCDAHFTETFFTYDTDSKEIINEEFKAINKFLDNLPKNYCGTLSSDLSLLYCDNIVKYIFDYLEKNKLIDNTTVVITADHGFSYYFNPVREKYVISSYRENYNVPFIIYDKNIKPKMINKYLATKDIPATILDLAGLKIPKTFKGKSLLNYNGGDYATLEYMGGGCPDIKRRPTLLGIRDDNYDVIAEVFENNIKVKEVYDMKKDPYQNHNLYRKKLNIEYELNLIKKRYDEIIKDLK